MIMLTKMMTRKIMYILYSTILTDRKDEYNVAQLYIYIAVTFSREISKAYYNT